MMLSKFFVPVCKLLNYLFFPVFKDKITFFVSPFDMISIWDNVKSNILTGQYFYEENISYFKWEKCVLLFQFTLIWSQLGIISYLNLKQIFVLISVPPQLPILMDPSPKESFKKARNRALKTAKNKCTLRAFLSWFPIIHWIRNYKLEFLSGDVIAGVTCALTMIPQGIGNVPLAGLPLEVSFDLGIGRVHQYP